MYMESTTTSPDSASRPFRLSFFANIHDNEPKHHELTWEEFVDANSEHEFTTLTKRQVPLFCPAEFKEGGTRLDKDVERLHLFVIDLDEVATEEVESTLKAAEAYEYLAYTSWSHGRDPNRLRLVFPLSRPVDVADWQRFWPKAVHHLGNLGDATCCNASRFYVEPYAPVGDEDSHFVVYNRGTSLDVEAVMALPEPEGPVGRQKGREERPSDGALTAAHFTALLLRLKRRSTPHAQLVANALGKIIKGLSFAQEGERDMTLFKVIGEVLKAYPSATDESVVTLLLPSLELMEAQSPGAPTAEIVRDKLARERARLEAEKQADEAAAQTRQARHIKIAFRDQRATPYTLEELTQHAHGAGVSTEELKGQLLVRSGNAYYIFIGGDYEGPHSDPVDRVRDLLAPALGWGVDLCKVTKDGKIVDKSASELMEDYGATVAAVEYDLAGTRARLDRSRNVLVLAPCALRDLEPKEATARQKEMLRNLCGGDPDTYDRLLDWLACAPDLSKLLPALYVWGAGKVGKSWFASLLARLFPAAEVTPLARGLERFNSAVVKAPVLFGDEALSCTLATFRELVTARSRPIEHKGVDGFIEAKGCTRIVLADNTGSILKSRDVGDSQESIDAVADRLLVLHAPDGTEPLLYEETRDWDPDWLAQYCLHLAATRDVKPEGRFACRSSPPGKVSNEMIRKGGLSSAILDHVLGAVLDPGKQCRRSAYADATFEPGVRVKDGEVWVSSTRICDNWEAYSAFDHKPRSERVGKELQMLCHKASQRPGKRLTPLLQGQKPREYFPVRMDMLRAHAAYYLPEELDAALAVDTTRESLKVRAESRDERNTEGERAEATKSFLPRTTKSRN